MKPISVFFLILLIAVIIYFTVFFKRANDYVIDKGGNEYINAPSVGVGQIGVAGFPIAKKENGNYYKFSNDTQMVCITSPCGIWTEISRTEYEIIKLKNQTSF